MADFSKLKSYLNVFTPSPIGVLLSLVVTGYAMVLNQFSSIKHYLRLPDDANFLHPLAVWLDKLLTTVLGTARTNVVVVGAFWAIVGLGVYVLLRTMAKYIAELDDDIEERHFVWPKGADRTRPLKVTMIRTVFRVLALIALIIVLAGPVAKVLKGPVFVDLIGPSLVLQYVIWFFSSMIICHVVVILLRLIALRTRIVGEG